MTPGDQTVTRRKVTRHKAARRKPTMTQLGVDPAKLDWQRSGTGAGSLEVAFVGGQAERTGAGTGGAEGAGGAGGNWVVLRGAGDPTGRVLVYDRTEWKSSLYGV